MRDVNQLNIRPVARWTAVAVAGLATSRLALPHAAVGLLVGVAVNGGMLLFLVRGARACARGDLDAKPVFKPETPPGETPNVRVNAYARTRAREAA